MHAVVTKNLPKVTADGESGSPDNMEDYNLWHQHQGYHQVKCAENKPYGKSGKKKGWAEGPRCGGAMELEKEKGVGGWVGLGQWSYFAEEQGQQLRLILCHKPSKKKESRERGI